MNEAIIVVASLAQLTPQQREAYVDYTVLERTQQDIADRMGISRQRVHMLIRKARDKIGRDSLLLSRAA